MPFLVCHFLSGFDVIGNERYVNGKTHWIILKNYNDFTDHCSALLVFISENLFQYNNNVKNI
jgi:hypothetical protein